MSYCVASRKRLSGSNPVVDKSSIEIICSKMCLIGLGSSVRFKFFKALLLRLSI